MAEWPSGGLWTRRGLDVGFDDLPGRVLASTAARGDREIGLHLAERAGATIHDFADLPIADCMAHADIHRFDPVLGTAAVSAG